MPHLRVRDCQNSFGLEKENHYPNKDADNRLFLSRQYLASRDHPDSPAALRHSSDRLRGWAGRPSREDDQVDRFGCRECHR